MSKPISKHFSKSNNRFFQACVDNGVEVDVKLVEVVYKKVPAHYNAFETRRKLGECARRASGNSKAILDRALKSMSEVGELISERTIEHVHLVPKTHTGKVFKDTIRIYREQVKKGKVSTITNQKEDSLMNSSFFSQDLVNELGLQLAEKVLYDCGCFLAPDQDDGGYYAPVLCRKDRLRRLFVRARKIRQAPFKAFMRLNIFLDDNPILREMLTGEFFDVFEAMIHCNRQYHYPYVDDTAAIVQNFKKEFLPLYVVEKARRNATQTSEQAHG